MTEELDRARAREAATRDILGIISRNRDDELPVFDAILRRAARLCDADAAALALGKAGDTHQRLVATYGVDAATVAVYDRGEVSMNPDISLAAKVILTGKVVHVDDMMETEGYRRGVGHFVSAVRDTGARTQMFVPLLTTAGGIGAFIIFRKEVRPYTVDEISLVESFAAQAVIAIENVRQFHELQTRLEREAATKEILTVISQSRDDEAAVFDTILQKAATLCGADQAGLQLVTESRSHFRLVADRGQKQTAFELGKEWPMNSPLTSAVAIRSAKVVHIPDLADTDLFRIGNPTTVHSVEIEGVRTRLAVPLLQNGIAIGSISLSRHEVRSFESSEIQLVETFAAQAVIAIENVRQFKALEALNAELGRRVEAQVDEIERMGRLRRFLPAAVADAVVSSGSEKMLSSHRALLGVLFCDIRGFTAFCETAEPEETIEVLQTYHQEMGKLINEHGAGVDHRSGDGIMVLFNDPLPCDDPAGNAVRLAIAMRARMAELCLGWNRLGHRLGFGMGVSLGYATVGMVGFEGRIDYTASGTAINLASRLCDEALDGEILISPRARIAVEERFEVESRGEIDLKGIREPVEVFKLTGVSAA